MTYQTIKVDDIGEVPIIGEVNSFTGKVSFYTKDGADINFLPKQTQKPDFSDKNALKRSGQTTNQPTLL